MMQNMPKIMPGLALAAALALSACGPADKVATILDVGFAAAGEVRDKAVTESVKASVTGARNYCRLRCDRRAEIREMADGIADADPDTAGLRIRITGGPCACDAE